MAEHPSSASPTEHAAAETTSVAPDDAYYDVLSEWAETYTITGPQPGDLHGEDAAAAGQALIAAARAGRPALDPDAQPGEQARIRHVRLDTALDRQLDQRVRELADEGQKVTASQLLRDALAAYLNQPAA